MEKLEMREKIAELVQRNAGDINFGYAEISAATYHEQTILPLTDQILTLISKEIEKGENPYRPIYDDEAYDVHAAYEEARQKILSLLKE